MNWRKDGSLIVIVTAIGFTSGLATGLSQHKLDPPKYSNTEVVLVCGDYLKSSDTGNVSLLCKFEKEGVL